MDVPFNPIVLDESRLADGRVLSADQQMAKDIAETLMRHYPGHAWAVDAHLANGVVNVKNLHLSSKIGFRLMVSDLTGPSAIRKEAIEAGGALLEAFGVRRGAFRTDDLNRRPQIDPSAFKRPRRRIPL